MRPVPALIEGLSKFTKLDMQICAIIQIHSKLNRFRNHFQLTN